MKFRCGRAFAVLFFGLGGLLATACGNSSKPAHDGAAAHGGGDGAASEDATDGHGDTASGDGAAASDAGDVATGADAGDVATGADASDAADASSGEVLPEIDAGAGCLSPGSEMELSPTAEGLPALGLVLWVRADRGVYKTAQNEVCGWRDQSDQARLLIPSSTRPTWQTSAVGGQAGIVFSVAGQDLYVSGTVGITPTSARTFIAVSQLVNPAGRFHPILQGEGDSPGTYVGLDANTWQTAGNLEGVYVTNNSFDTTLATVMTPRVHVMTLSTLALGTVVTSALDYRVNGATQTFTLKAGTGSMEDFSTANFTTVGAVSGTPSAGASGGTGIVAEALIYDRALTVAERMAVETVLKARYGIQ